MANILYGPTSPGFVPSSVSVRTLTGVPAATFGSDGSPAAPTIDGQGRVSFYAPHGTYRLVLKQAGSTDVTTLTVTLQDPISSSGIPTFKSWRIRPTASPFPDTDQYEMVFHNNVVWDGKMYLVGHYTQAAEQNSMVSYEEVTDTWATLTPPPNKPTIPGVAVVNGKIYVFMGNIAMLQVYDIATDTWAVEAAVPPLAVNDARAVAVGTTIYVLGAGAFYAYNTVTKTYTQKTNTPHDAGGDVDLDYLNGKIYAVGVFNEATAYERLYAYSIADDSWTELAAPPDALPANNLDGYLSSSVIHDGEIYKIGGFSVSVGTYVYNIATDTWRTAPTYPYGGVWFAAAGEINGVLLAFGKRGLAGPSHMVSLDKTKYQISVNELGDVEGEAAEGTVLTKTSTGWGPLSVGQAGSRSVTVSINVGFNFTINSGNRGTGNSSDLPMPLTNPPAETSDVKPRTVFGGNGIIVKKPGLWLFYATIDIQSAPALPAGYRLNDGFSMHLATDFTDLEAVGVEQTATTPGYRRLMTEHLSAWLDGSDDYSYVYFTRNNFPTQYGGLPDGTYSGFINCVGHRLTS